MIKIPRGLERLLASPGANPCPLVPLTGDGGDVTHPISPSSTRIYFQQLCCPLCCLNHATRILLPAIKTSTEKKCNGKS